MQMFYTYEGDTLDFFFYIYKTALKWSIGRSSLEVVQNDIRFHLELKKSSGGEPTDHFNHLPSKLMRA